jgi:type IV pilus assembly protein PilM
MSPARSSQSWLASPPPNAALEITAARVTALSVVDQKGTPVISAYASETLAPGAVEPTLNAANVHDSSALSAAIRSALSNVGRARRVALVLPDSVAKVSLIRFDKVPPKLSDLEQLIRWQMRKAAPFRIEDAQIAWQAGAAIPGGGREYLVTVARRDIVLGYERACEAAGTHAGIVDLASFNHVNAGLASGRTPGDWLLVHVAADYTTLAVVRGDDVVSFRNRTGAGQDDLVELVHQTAMYHEDRLGGGGFSRVVLAGASVLGIEETERLRRLLYERIGLKAELPDFRSAVSMRDRIAAGPELLDALAPSVGVLLRERAHSTPSGRAGQVA